MKKQALVAAVVPLLLVLAGCGDPMTGMIDPGGPTARVRVLHLSPDAPKVDAYVGEARAVSMLAFSSSSEVVRAPAGRARIEVTAAGQSTAAATLSDVLLEADRDYTVFAFGKVAGLQLNALENDTTALASNSVRLRVVHAADGVGTVNVYQVPPAGTPTPIAENLRYGTAATPVDLPPEGFTAGIDVDGDRSVDLTFEVPALPRGTVVNAFAVLDAAGAPFILAQLSGSANARLDPQVAQLRVLHLSASAPGVRAFVDGSLPEGFSELMFTQSTPNASLSAAKHRLDVSASATAAGAVLSAAALPLGGGKKYTAVAIGPVTALRALFFEDVATALPSGDIRIRAIHAAPSVGTVDLFTLGADGKAAPLLSDVAYGDVSAPLDVPAGAYTVGVDTNNDANPELWFALPALSAGTVANVYVTQGANGEVFALAQLDGPATARIDRATTKLRVIHLSRNAPSVDVYANGTKVVSALAYATSTPTLTVGAGAYDLAVTAAGGSIGSAVINARGVKLLPGKAYTVAAYGDLANIAAEVLEDHVDGINTATDIRLEIIHVAPTVTRGDVYAVKPTGNTLLAPNIGFGEAAKIPDLVSSSYRVGFDAESNGTIDIAFNLPVLAPGSYANVFVATDAAGMVYLLVQTTGAGTIRVNPAP